MRQRLVVPAPMRRVAAAALMAALVVALVVTPAVMPMATARAAQAAPQAAPAAASGVPAGSPNAYASGGDVRAAVPVDGDFVAVGGRVLVAQPVRGDALLAGGSVAVEAPVGDDLRAAGGDVRIASTVAGEALAAGGNVLLGPAAQVGRGAALYGGTVRVEGRVDGPLRVRAQTVVLRGEVGGDADLRGEHIELGPGARIGGGLRYASPNELLRTEGAVVGGPVTRLPTDWRWRDEQERGARDAEWREASPGAGWAAALPTYLGVLASGALLLLVLPRFAGDAVQALAGAPGRALLLGTALMLGLPLLALMLFVTLLGIPLGLALLLLMPPLLLAGYVIGAQFVADRARAALKPGAGPATAAATIGFFALALLLLMLLGRLPLVGWLVTGAVALLGLGAAVLAIHRRRQRPAAAAA